MRETRVFASLNHENIVNYHSSWLEFNSIQTLKQTEKNEKKKKTLHIEEYSESSNASLSSTSSQAALSSNAGDKIRPGKIAYRNRNKLVPIIDEPKSDIKSESIVFEEEQEVEEEKTEANKTEDSTKTKKLVKTSDSSNENEDKEESDSSSSSSNGGNKFFQSHEKSNLSSFSSINKTTSKLTQSQHVSFASSKCARKELGQTSNKQRSHEHQSELSKQSSHQQELLVAYIQMRLCDFTLKYWLKHRNEQIFMSNAELDESMCASLCRQILSGVEYLHSKSIIHRDLKV